MKITLQNRNHFLEQVGEGSKENLVTNLNILKNAIEKLGDSVEKLTDRVNKLEEEK